MNMINKYQTASQRSNCDFTPLVDHHSALEYSTKYARLRRPSEHEILALTYIYTHARQFEHFPRLYRYATKSEKGSAGLGKLFSAALSKIDEREELSDAVSAKSVFGSFLVQQIGARDWSAQEVAHVNMGWRTVWASHKFDGASLGDRKGILKNIDPTADDSVVATTLNKWELYLARDASADDTQSTLDKHGFGTTGANHGITLAQVDACSFTEFWRHFHYVSAGRNGGRKLQRRKEPTVVLVSPWMPSAWGKREHPNRAAYCQRQLRAHKPFADAAHYQRYLHDEHGGDFEAAYEEFGKHHEDAPACCKDDFRSVVFEDEGEEVEDPDAAPGMHPDFQLYQVNPVFHALATRIAVGHIDWAARSAERYEPERIGSAARWLDGVKARAVPPEAVSVDPDELNEGQAFTYRVIADHNQRRLRQPTQPLRTLICGTAGSGKTWLIRAIKQLLGDACLVLAPTGVAASNVRANRLTFCTYATPLRHPHGQSSAHRMCSCYLCALRSAATRIIPRFQSRAPTSIVRQFAYQRACQGTRS